MPLKDLNILIVEDDKSFALQLEMWLSEMGFQEIFHASTVAEANSFLNEQEVHIALVDIYIDGERGGFNLAENLKQKNTPFIFLTAHPDDEIFESASQHQPNAFLGKRIDEEILKKAILSILNSILTHPTSPPQNTSESPDIFLKTGQQLHRVNLSDIIWIQSDGNYCIFKTTQRKFAMKGALKRYQVSLPNGQFIRIHQRYIVQMAKIERIDLTSDSVLIDGEELPIGRKYRPAVLKRLHML